MVLYTMNREYTEFAIRRLENQNISYTIQEVGTNKINLFFGKPECMEAIRHIITRPLNQLTPEEDFILGAMLGYDICQQCKRYCGKKKVLRLLFSVVLYVLALLYVFFSVEAVSLGGTASFFHIYSVL